MQRLRSLALPLTGVGPLGTAVRAAVAVTLPIVVGQATGNEGLGLFATVGAINVAIADNGGPFGQRLAGMGSAVIGVVAAAAAGTALSGNPWAAVPALAVVAFVAGLIRHVGQTGLRVGMVVAIAFLLGAGLPGGGAGERTLAVLVGSTLALLLVVVVWPLDVHGPARDALVGSLRGIAAYARAGAAGKRPVDEAAAARNALDRLRAELDSLGAFRGRASERLDRLTAASRSAARLYAATASTVHARERAVERGAPFPTSEVDAALEALADATERLASAEQDGCAVDLAGLAAAVAGAADACAHAGSEAAAVAARALPLAERHARALAAAPGEGPIGRGDRVPFRPSRSLVETMRESLVTVRSQLGLGSDSLRYALKLGFAAAAAMAVALAIGVEHVYWAPLTVLVVLQPGARETVHRAFDRTLGTVVGAIAAALVAAIVTTDAVLDVLIFVLSATVFLLFTRAYRWAVAALTSLVLLMIETVLPSGWEAAAYRIGNTLLGAAIGIAVAILVWRTPRRTPLVQSLVDVARALRSLQLGIVSGYQGQTGQTFGALGRRAGHALVALDAARGAVRPGPAADAAARAAAGARDAADALLALDLVPLAARPRIATRVEELGEQVTSTMDDLARALETEAAPAEPADFEVGLASARSAASAGDEDVRLAIAELERLAAGMRTLTEAVDAIARDRAAAA